MCFEAAFPGESFVANCTLKSFLSLVSESMPFEVVFVRESFMANYALKRFLSSMCVTMAL
jgi:hypothetical protein